MQDVVDETLRLGVLEPDASEIRMVLKETLQLWRSIPAYRASLPLYEESDTTVPEALCEAERRSVDPVNHAIKYLIDLIGIQTVFGLELRSEVAPGSHQKVPDQALQLHERGFHFKK
jgi:hypothetical protein